MSEFIITIDGPAGAGKTTVAREVGLRLNWFVLESGLLYRAVAFVFHQNKLEPCRKNYLKAAKVAISRMKIEKTDKGVMEIEIDGQPLSSSIKSPEIGEIASHMAADAEVRRLLLSLQHSIAKRERNIVAEGRDMGTTVFPNADAKFFLTASAEIRAKRRLQELEKLGLQPSLDEVLKQIIDRDERDKKRALSPLKPAHEAIQIDTTLLTIREVVNEIIEVIPPKIKEQQEADLYETRF